MTAQAFASETSTAARRRLLAPAAAVASLVAVLAGTPASAVAAGPSLQVSAKPIAKALSVTAAKTTIAVKNTGKTRVSGLALSVKPAKGVRITLSGAKKGRLSRALKPLAAGRTVRVGVSVRRTSAGPKSGSLTVKVTRKGKAVAKGGLAFGPSATPSPGTSGPGASPASSLAGRYFWASSYTVSGTRQLTLYFTGPNLVFTGPTESAWPGCAAVSEVCKPYTYDGTTKQLTIDGRPATIDGLKISLDGQSYLEFGYPPAGVRWDTVVTYANSSGVCPLMCTYWREDLTFRPDGTFVRDAIASGTGPVVDWASIPPDHKGTYEVRADHTLRLGFEDGTERIETVGLYLNADGTLQAPGAGMILGGDGYFDIRE